jgi:16S rRNA A1518/A1519 N6-dimethyltransferase RsmA/KsgA/DIM1 with predicted DNA glycosylase/AP lyase activity
MTLSQKFEQHMLTDLTAYRDLIQTIDFTDYKILEIGVGTGALTQLLGAKAGYDKIVGFEIDPSIVPSQLARKIDLRIGDITQADLSFLQDEKFMLIANPPYSLHGWIRENILDQYPDMPAILMTSPSRQSNLGKNFQKCFELNGDAFTPPARGTHIVCQRHIL